MFDNLNETHYLLIIVSIFVVFYVVYWFRYKTHEKHQVTSRVNSPRLNSKIPSKSKSEPEFVLYNFYSPMCGYCKQFMPVWNQLQAELKGHLNLAFRTINASDPANERISFYYNVNKYPTIILVTPQKNIEYVGNRTADDFKDFLSKYM